MAEESLFRNIIEFLVELGIYDVILPFLLVFAIVYAIFDKTKVLGTEDFDGHQIPKKNINAMIAFVIGFLVIASKQLVATINKAVANIALLLILIGVFFKKDEEISLSGPWRITFMISILISIIFIFFDALPTRSGDKSWLQWGWDWIVSNWSGNAFGSIVMLILVIVLIILITWDKTPSSSTNGGS